jgi:hypothetical protein
LFVNSSAFAETVTNDKVKNVASRNVDLNCMCISISFSEIVGGVIIETFYLHLTTLLKYISNIPFDAQPINERSTGY